ncbi:MAG: hypothetical protein J5653_10780 [Clostridiales bacterium]|nr:hypothetical protein [Clostridiales bacterium]
MKGKMRKIRFSIPAAICMLVLFALIFAPWAYFSRKATIRKVDDKLSRRREKATDYMSHTQYNEYTEYSETSSSLLSWSDLDRDPYRYTDPDGDTFSIREFEPALPSFFLSCENGVILSLSSMEYGAFDVVTPYDNMDKLYTSMFKEVQNISHEIDDLELGADERIIGTVAGHRYLISKAQVKMVSTYPPTSKNPDKTEIVTYENYYLVFCEDMAPFLDEWKLNVEKNALALLITLLTSFAIIFILEERVGVKGLYIEPQETTDVEETVTETDEGREFMSSEAAKALLQDLEQAEQVMGDNGYTKQIRDEISKYL